MPSERVQRRIDELLDQAEAAIAARDWAVVTETVEGVLAVDPDNADAKAFMDIAQRASAARPDMSASAMAEALPLPSSSHPRTGFSSDHVETPASFANDRYQVSRFLGEGGKKRVYQAHDTLLDREVAFALIKTEGFDQTSKERISREAQAMGRLGVHPNIVAVLDLGQEDDGSPYMVTELMGGGDVEALLAAVAEITTPEPPPTLGEGLGVGRDDADAMVSRGNGLPLDRTIEIGKAVCEGLEFAHARGIVHRDLKPGNVWLTEDGIAKIGDFGLAVMTDRSRLTREGMMVGTVSYMPPEQATGGEITPRADLYSLGAMLYEMVTGRPPFLGDDEIAIIGQHINTPPVAPTWHNGTCPRPLEALIMRLLSKDPSERPDTAQDVLNALDAIDLTARGETVEREANSLESLAGGVFVGRQAEMDQLKAALEDVLGGRGRLVTLVGEPGIGKTRTSEELATYAGLRGALVLFGHCYEGGGAPSYWPWVQAIRSYVRDIDADELRRQMGSSASVVAEIVTDVKDRLPELQPPPQIDDPDSARFRLFDSITSFLRTASQAQPLVIVLDDLHWSDQPSLTFLEFIARELNQSRVLLLCTYRDMELNRRHQLTVTLGDLARDRLYERVLLRGLTETDIARFVEIAAGFAAPRELSATVHRHTEGNPLFVTEVIRDLVQSGELTEEKISGRSTWSVRIPEGVREVIGRRLDRLSDRANEVFTTASVIGRDFTLDALRVLAEDTTEGQLLDVVDEGLDAKIIEELPDALGHYQFTHALVQETLSDELSTTRRVRLHARIAETLEELYGEEADDHAEELIPHFDEAEAVVGTERLVHYSVLAGEAALEAFAPRAALIHFERAAARIRDADRDMTAARTFSGLGLAGLRIFVDNQQKYWDIFARGFDIYLELGENSTAVSLATNVVFAGAHVSGSTMVSEKALESATPGSVDAGRLMARAAVIHWLEFGDTQRQAEYERLALEISSATGDSSIEMRALAGRGSAAYNRHEYSEALAATLRVIELARSRSDMWAETVAYGFAVLSHLALGEGRKAQEQIQAMGDLIDRTRTWSGLHYSFIALYANMRGDWTEIRSVAEIGSADPVISIMALMATAQTELEIDALSLDELISVDNVDDPGTGIGRDLFAASFMHSVKLEPSEPERLIGLIADTRSNMDRGTMRHDRYGSLSTRLAASTACLAESIIPEELADWAYNKLEPLSRTALEWMSVDRMLGRLAKAMDRRADAISHFEDGLVFCRNSGYRPELAWTCSDYAEMLLDRADGARDSDTDAEGASRASARGVESDREKAIELQDEAQAITQELGMRPLTERILARREILRT